MPERASVFNPVEQRVYGLVQVAQGLVTIVLGRHAPSWALSYARWGARRAGEREQVAREGGRAASGR